LIKATMFNAEIIECAKGGAGKVAKFGMVSFSFELSDNCDRDDDFMLFKAEQRSGISQEHAGI
jgi:hypothetical protein